jgi:hypothetical protein
MQLDLDTLPPDVIVYIGKLRREAAKHRLERNEARAELAELRAELGR